MAIAIRGTPSIINIFGGNPITQPAISGISAGDLYIDLGHNIGSGATALSHDPTSTFTTFLSGSDSSGSRLYDYARRIATGAEGTLTTNGATNGLTSAFFALSGVDTTTPMESIQSAVPTFSGSWSASTIPASTPTTDNCWHVISFLTTDALTETFTTPSGYTLLAAAGSWPSVGSGGMQIFYKALGAGSSGVATAAISSAWSTNGSGLAAGFIVRPASVTASDPSASTSHSRQSNRHTAGLRR